MEKTKSSFGRVKAQVRGSLRPKAKPVDKPPVMPRDYALADKRAFIHSVPTIYAGNKSEMFKYALGYVKAFITGAHRVAVK